MTTSCSNGMPLRTYQTSAIEAIQRGFDEYQKQLLVLPTGGGKTILFSHLAAMHQPRRTLVIAHREELIQQAVDKIHKATGIVAEIEKAEQCASFDAPVVVASIQTLSRRKVKWPKDHFGLIVVDEAHHVLADSYLNVLSHFDQNAFVLGVTATPDRGDKRGLSKYFENIAYEVSLLDLIKQSWLSPIKVKTLPLQISLQGCRTIGGDYNDADLGHAIEPYLEAIADQLIEYQHRKILVFLPLISLSQKFADLCRNRGLLAEHVDGSSPDRAAILQRFRNNHTRLLSNAMLLTEGYDEPSIDCVVMLRPTKIRSLYSQVVGRGTRIWPNKDHLLLLDFLWLSEKHNLIKPAHLIAKDDEEAEEITSILEEDGNLEEAKERVDADRSRRLTETLRQNASRRGRTFDAMEFLLSINEIDLADFQSTMCWHDDPVTAKQSELLNRYNIDPSTAKNKGHASAIIDKLITRVQMKLATPKQVRWLKKLGHKQPELATFQEASEFLDKRWNGV